MANITDESGTIITDEAGVNITDEAGGGGGLSVGVQTLSLTINSASVQSTGAVLVNKIDLTDLRSISEEEGDEAAKKMDCNAHLLVSAKENKNVDNAFTELTKSFLKKN